MRAEVLLTLATLLPFVGSASVALLARRGRNLASVMAGGFALCGFVLMLVLHPQVVGGGTISARVGWIPSLGLDLVLRLDGLSWLFAVLVLGIGTLVILYARGYLSPEDSTPRFLTLFLGFMGAMLGVVLSGNLVQLVVAWELTSLFSFLLVGYWHGKGSARDGARMALTVTAAGGLCLLAGVALIGHIVGSTDLATVLASGDAIRQSPYYLPALLLVLAGAFTKSAQVPFHFWLPRAMAAPTPASAYLHSATMVKAGIYLMIRLYPVLAETDAWYAILGTAGMATMLLGAWCAVFQHDLKGVLAYSTISHLGLITLLLGLDSNLSVVAAIFHTVNHAIFKASLFMAAGIIDHQTGTRDLRKLGGLWRSMPHTATLATVAAAAMAGVPILNGFLSKEMFLAEAVSGAGDRDLNLALPVLATIGSALTVLYSLRFVSQIFFGRPGDLPREPHEPVRWMRVPVELLVLACIALGLVPSLTVGPILDPAVTAVFGEAAPHYSLSLWHGFSPELGLSLLALAGGGGLYVWFGRRINANPRGGPWLLSRLDSAGAFEATMIGLERGARWLESRLGTGRFQGQLRALFVVALAAGIALAGRTLVPVPMAPIRGIDPSFALLWLVGGTCAVGAAYKAKYHRLSAVILASGAGLVSCLTFAWLSAPDLALTQILIEILTGILLLLGLRWLPKRDAAIPATPAQRLHAGRRRTIDGVLALSIGIGLAMLAYAVMTRPRGEGVSRAFVELAYPGAGGHNVVNVLLTDFRAFDTLGEIAVLGLVGLTVLSLLRRFRPAADTLGPPRQQRLLADADRRRDRAVGATLADALLVPQVVMTWAYPFCVLLALHLFLRGHDLPGGGFAAGVVLAIGFVLLYMANGAEWVEERLRIRPLAWVGGGLLVAVLCGAAPWAFGHPFLTSWHDYVDLPLIGKIPLASALVFDLGVVALVVGASVLMLTALARQSLRRSREDSDTTGDSRAETM